MAYADVRAALKSLLEGISGINKVYDYQRWTADRAVYAALFKDTDKIHFWCISRRAVTDTRRYTEQVDDVHRIVIRGYMALDDSEATEKTFQDLIDTVRQTLRQNYTILGTAHNSGPEINTIIEHRVFGEVLCHYCEVELPVRERKAKDAA